VRFDSHGFVLLVMANTDGHAPAPASGRIKDFV